MQGARACWTGHGLHLQAWIRVVAKPFNCAAICCSSRANRDIARATKQRREKRIMAVVVMLHLRARYVSKTAILGCWADRSGQKSKSRLNSKDLNRLASCMTPH
jgi:hypothetical protein